MALFPLATAALAHARLVKSEPAAGSTVTVAPKEVIIWFNEEVDTRQSSIRVTNAAGAPVDLGNSKVNLDDRKQITVGLQLPLANGVYLVRWHAVTPDDNGVSDGEFQFTLNAPAQPTAAATAAPVPSPTLAPAPTVAAATATAVPPSPAPATPTPAPPAPTLAPAAPAPPAATPAPAPAPGSVDPATMLVLLSLVVVGAGAFLLLRKR